MMCVADEGPGITVGLSRRLTHDYHESVLNNNREKAGLIDIRPSIENVLEKHGHPVRPAQQGSLRLLVPEPMEEYV